MNGLTEATITLIYTALPQYSIKMAFMFFAQAEGLIFTTLLRTHGALAEGYKDLVYYLFKGLS